jgi:hypothetical protein
MPAPVLGQLSSEPTGNSHQEQHDRARGNTRHNGLPSLCSPTGNHRGQCTRWAITPGIGFFAHHAPRIRQQQHAAPSNKLFRTLSISIDHSTVASL